MAEQNSKGYLFTSARLGFRNWRDEDLEPMAKISRDPTVMEFFPSTQSTVHTAGFIERMQVQFKENGYCYFAVDKLDTDEMIGFIGIAKQTFEADFTPCIDIGWRLGTAHWKKGYATEGAKRCLEFAFDELQIDEIVSIASEINTSSIHVMQKIGMTKKMNFDHPLLKDYPKLFKCELWTKSRDAVS